MDIGKIISESGLTLPKLARLSGVSEDTLRSLKGGRRGGRDDTLSKVGKALRAHGLLLTRNADLLDPPSVSEPAASPDHSPTPPASPPPDRASPSPARKGRGKDDGGETEVRAYPKDAQVRKPTKKGRAP